MFSLSMHPETSLLRAGSKHSIYFYAFGPSYREEPTLITKQIFLEYHMTPSFIQELEPRFLYKNVDVISNKNGGVM